MASFILTTIQDTPPSGNFMLHQNSSYHDFNSMKKLIGIPQRSERSSDLGTCYIIMITFFLVIRLQSKDDIAAEVSGYQDDVVGDEEEVYIARNNF